MLFRSYVVGDMEQQECSLGMLQDSEIHPVIQEGEESARFFRTNVCEVVKSQSTSRNKSCIISQQLTNYHTGHRVKTTWSSKSVSKATFLFLLCSV